MSSLQKKKQAQYYQYNWINASQYLISLMFYRWWQSYKYPLLTDDAVVFFPKTGLYLLGYLFPFPFGNSTYLP